ncbi:MULTISPECIES: helix-turn-helix domain-containing protein [Micrococcus]|nr:helix-turn-helix domain-containing protein [Micrococcus aloeverae]TFU83567.1 hypothetical protein E4T87_01830 [Micrococcus aloeverae]
MHGPHGGGKCAGDMTPREIADAAGVSVSTMYRLLHMDEAA